MIENSINDTSLGCSKEIDYSAIYERTTRQVGLIRTSFLFSDYADCRGARNLQHLNRRRDGDGNIDCSFLLFLDLSQCLEITGSEPK